MYAASASGLSFEIFSHLFIRPCDDDRPVVSPAGERNNLTARAVIGDHELVRSTLDRAGVALLLVVVFGLSIADTFKRHMDCRERERERLDSYRYTERHRERKRDIETERNRQRKRYKM